MNTHFLNRVNTLSNTVLKHRESGNTETANRCETILHNLMFDYTNNCLNNSADENYALPIEECFMLAE